MKLVVQRVKSALVRSLVTDKVVGRIDKGLFVLLGVKKGDTQKEVDILVEKLFKLRIMSDKRGKMNLSVADVEGSFLVVSQFTLYADTSAGNRPSFINAEDSKKAKKLYDYFVERLKDKTRLSGVRSVKVKTGIFGDYMQIKLQLDGPVTIILEE